MTKFEYEIVPSEHTFSPRENDNLGKMICFHRRYNLGDTHHYKSSDYNSFSEMKAAILKDSGRGAVILPIYAYIHSGVTISSSPFSCPWDSRQLGFIVATRESILENFMVKRITEKITEKTLAILEAEIKEYDQYIRGEAYAYEIFEVEYDEHGNELSREEIDSVGGYYSEEDCESDAKNIVEAYEKKVVA